MSKKSWRKLLIKIIISFIIIIFISILINVQIFIRLYHFSDVLQEYGVKYTNMDLPEHSELLDITKKSITLMNEISGRQIKISGVFTKDLSNTNRDGEFRYWNNISYIRIAENATKEYQKYIVCHELVHAFMWDIVKKDLEKYENFEQVCGVDYKNIEIPLKFGSRDEYEHENIHEFYACVVGEWLYNEVVLNCNYNETMNQIAYGLFNFD